jgi:hypothetical protein
LETVISDAPYSGDWLEVSLYATSTLLEETVKFGNGAFQMPL